jgi:PASTA domain-containing protein
MAVFSFTLDSFQITDTRSLHEDTDYVTYTLLVKAQDGSGTPRTLTKSMGDVNNGVHSVNLSFSNVQVNPTDTVVLNYLIVNSGHKNPGQITSALESAAGKLATQGGTLLGNAIAPGIGGSLLGAAAGWLAGELLGIITANCDGPVAAEQDTFKYSDLIADTANGQFKHSTKHPGIDSAKGCGRNSVYIVNWHMLQVGSPANKSVPNVIQIPATQAAQRIQAAGLVAKFTGQNGTGSWVFSQSPAAGAIVNAGSTVTMVLHTGPLP